jgi:hypothetical protein
MLDLITSHAGFSYKFPPRARKGIQQSPSNFKGSAWPRQGALWTLKEAKMKQQDTLSSHANVRMFARRIDRKSLATVVNVGRRIYTRKAMFYVIGRKEVRRWKGRGVDLSTLEGLHVVCTSEGTVMTVYKNRNLTKLRPHRRMRRAHFSVKFRAGALRTSDPSLSLRTGHRRMPARREPRSICGGIGESDDIHGPC